jgi:hypothetical protein
MKLHKNFPFWVACFVALVGLFYAALPMIENSLISFKSPHKYYVAIGGLIFFLAGCRYGYLSLKGQLKRQGINISDVRKRALDNYESKTYLAKVARDDTDPEVRKKAMDRLKELTK